MAGGSNLFTGTLELLVLRTVVQEPMHGYAIGKLIREVSRGILDVEEGALYPALHRLKQKGLLDGEWGLTPSGRRARFYRITKAGRRHLKAESVRWLDHVTAVSAVLLRPTGGGGKT
jgi:transcriptional regulator